MHYHIKAIIFLFIIIIASTLLFSLIYYLIEKNDPNVEEHNKGYFNSFYTSVTIQTLIGLDSEPKSNSLKAWYIVQSLFAYTISIGFIYIVLKNLFRPKGVSSPDRIEVSKKSK